MFHCVVFACWSHICAAAAAAAAAAPLCALAIEIMRENESLVRAAERSVEVGYQHKPSYTGLITAAARRPGGQSGSSLGYLSLA